jgi:hypothetical protein
VLKYFCIHVTKYSNYLALAGDDEAKINCELEGREGLGEVDQLVREMNEIKPTMVYRQLLSEMNRNVMRLTLIR